MLEMCSLWEMFGASKQKSGNCRGAIPPTQEATRGVTVVLLLYHVVDGVL